MKSTVAIVIDGVLRREVGQQPVPEGVRLYKTLAPMYNLVLFANDPEMSTGDAVLEAFFHSEGLDQHTKVYYWMPMFQGSSRVAQAHRLRNSGAAVEFIIEPDPEESARLMLAGFHVLHFMQAQYTRPSWRPDHKPAPESWDELVRREMQAKVSKAVDRRLQ